MHIRNHKVRQDETTIARSENPCFVTYMAVDCHFSLSTMVASYSVIRSHIVVMYIENDRALVYKMFYI